MGDPKGFLEIKRKEAQYRPVCQRIKDHCEVCILPAKEDSRQQASRCMDCGTPFCHWGCPIGNYIPEWNDLLFRGEWKQAFDLLNAANNLPEVTGRTCPASCEYACVLGINDDPVAIRENELAIIEYAFENGLIKPRPPQKRSGRKVAVVGSGPAGLACADQLNKAGHVAVVFEQADKIGGILRYGIPDFKLEKWVLERRIKLLKEEGVVFITGANIGKDIKAQDLREEFDAICLAGGCRLPRDLNIEGRDLKGTNFAMDYLIQANRRAAGEKIASGELIDAKGKRIVVIGGGDTGADCVGVAHRQQAACVIQIELMPQPDTCRSREYPWPKYPLILKTSSSHQEGGQRQWAVLTKKFNGRDNRLESLSCVKVKFVKNPQGCQEMEEISGSDFEIKADLIILSLGFISAERRGLLDDLAVELDTRGNVKTKEDFMTAKAGVFSCGDMRRGQSLIVWAISEGRRAAHYIDKYLMGRSDLPVL